MSKITNKWENMSEQEKKQAYDHLNEILRKKVEKEQKKQQSIEDRIKNIRRLWLGDVKFND